MSADWAAQRIKGLSLGKAVVDGLKRSLGLNKRPNDGMATKTLLESFRYPRLGRHDVGSRARQGDRQRQGLHPDGPWPEAIGAGWRGRLAHDRQPTDGDTVIRARHVISSAPMRELAGRIHPLPEAIPEAMELKYRDFLTVALKIRSDDLFPDNWIYIHDPKVQVGRIQNFRSGRPKWCPMRAWPAWAGIFLL
jgi:hypothetical protein